MPAQITAGVVLCGINIAPQIALGVMLRTLIGLIAKADLEEQAALLGDCKAKLDRCIEGTLGADYKRPEKWEGLEDQPFIAMAMSLAGLRIKYLMSKGLTRSDVAILRKWQRNLTVCDLRVREMNADLHS